MFNREICTARNVLNSKNAKVLKDWIWSSFPYGPHTLLVLFIYNSYWFVFFSFTLILVVFCSIFYHESDWRIASFSTLFSYFLFVLVYVKLLHLFLLFICFFLFSVVTKKWACVKKTCQKIYNNTSDFRINKWHVFTMSIYEHLLQRFWIETTKDPFFAYFILSLKHNLCTSFCLFRSIKWLWCSMLLWTKKKFNLCCCRLHNKTKSIYKMWTFSDGCDRA